MNDTFPLLEFAPSQPLSLGVEIEIQLLNKETLDLFPISPQILGIVGENHPKIKAEIFQSMLELNTGICQNVHQVRDDLRESINLVEKVCRSLGARIASSGSHPFAQYAHRKIFPAARYQELIDRNQWIARRLMIFGLHVHVGMRSGEHAIQMNNALLHYLPILLSLSSSSPFWNGEDTELASSRITLFEAIPTGGHPCQVGSWREFSDLYYKLLKSEAVRSPKDIWWDIRPSPSFGTLEVRICDGLPTLEETVAITALIHCLSILIDRQIISGRLFRAPPDWIMRENKWRASRWGMEANFILNESGDTRNLRLMLSDLMIELQSIVEENGYQREFAFIQDLTNSGTSHQRQRRFVTQVNSDLKALTDYLAREFEARVPLHE